MAHRRGRALLAAAIVAALAELGGCAQADRVVYVALVGEAPGDKPLYTGFSPSARLGRAHPVIPEQAYRPPVEADTPGGNLADAARAARQTMSDRASDYELRVRYLRLDADEFDAATAVLKPTVGQPLPPDDSTAQARIAAARKAMARVQADILILNGIVQRSDQAKADAGRVLAAVKAGGAAAQPLAGPLAKGMSELDRMQKDGAALVDKFVVWLADQRTALDTLESEIRSGVAAGPAILNRQSIFQ
jgi:hypothetical protein